MYLYMKYYPRFGTRVLRAIFGGKKNQFHTIPQRIPVDARNVGTMGDIGRKLVGDPKRASKVLLRGRMDHPSSGKNQGKLRTNQPQLTPAQDDSRKRKFRVPRFVAGNQAVSQYLISLSNLRCRTLRPNSLVP